MSNNYIALTGFGFDPVEVFTHNNLISYFNDNQQAPADGRIQGYLARLALAFEDRRKYYQTTHSIIEAALNFDDNIECYYHQYSFNHWKLLDGPQNAIYLPDPSVIIHNQIDPAYTYDGAVAKLASAIVRLGDYLNINLDNDIPDIREVDIISDYLTWYNQNHQYCFSQLQIIEEKKGL